MPAEPWAQFSPISAANRPLPLPGDTRRAQGAAALAPENTLRSLELAVELGCDLVEFDVLDLDDGTLVLAHSDDLEEVSHGAARGRVRPLALQQLREVAPELPTLDDALAFMSDRAPGTGLHVDVKAAGCEQEIEPGLARGARVFAWTVDDAEALGRMVNAGVDGVITNDPGIFRDTL